MQLWPEHTCAICRFCTSPPPHSRLAFPSTPMSQTLVSRCVARAVMQASRRCVGRRCATRGRASMQVNSKSVFLIWIYPDLSEFLIVLGLFFDLHKSPHSLHLPADFDVVRAAASNGAPPEAGPQPSPRGARAWRVPHALGGVLGPSKRPLFPSAQLLDFGAVYLFGPP